MEKIDFFRILVKLKERNRKIKGKKSRKFTEIFGEIESGLSQVWVVVLCEPGVFWASGRPGLTFSGPGRAGLFTKIISGGTTGLRALIKKHGTPNWLKDPIFYHL